MMKKLSILLSCLVILCFAARADEILSVKLDYQNKDVPQIVELPFANVTFKADIHYGDVAKVEVTLENITTDHYFLLFKNFQNEKSLKNNSPKIEFEKSYGGEKGSRSVKGCKYLSGFTLLYPAQSQTLFKMDVSLSKGGELELPIYLSAYNPKKVLRSDKYSILKEEVIKFVIEVKNWDESDPTFVSVKKSIADFKNSLKPKMFCNSSSHKPALQEQQRPYRESQERIIATIDSVFKANYEWMSQDLPHQSYSKLLEEIKAVDLDKYAANCGRHSTPDQHKCSYCSLSAEQIYYQLDDTYQKLHTGALGKDAAVKIAKALNNCYQKNKRRKRDNFYGGKITEFYNRIVNY